MATLTEIRDAEERWRQRIDELEIRARKENARMYRCHRKYTDRLRDAHIKRDRASRDAIADRNYEALEQTKVEFALDVKRARRYYRIVTGHYRVRKAN